MESEKRDAGQHLDPAEERLAGALEDLLRIAIIHGNPDVDQTVPQRKWLSETIPRLRAEFGDDFPGMGEYLESLAARDQRWRTIAADWGAHVHGGLRPLLEMRLCILWPIAEPVPLGEGVHERRLDAVLDLLETPLAASDVQVALYVKAYDYLVDSSKNYLGAMATEFAGGYARGMTAAFLGDEVGRLAERGVAMVGHGINKGAGEEIADALAQFATLRALSEGEELDEFVAVMDAWLVERYQSVLAEIGERRRQGLSLEGREGVRRMLRTLIDEYEISIPESDPQDLDVTGMRLSDAKALLALHGHTTITTVDLARSAQDGRTPFMENGWLVAEQDMSGSVVVLGIHKTNESPARSLG